MILDIVVWLPRKNIWQARNAVARHAGSRTTRRTRSSTSQTEAWGNNRPCSSKKRNGCRRSGRLFYQLGLTSVLVGMTSLIDQLKTRTGYMTLQDVADLLGIHDMTLRKWAKCRKIQSFRIAIKSSLTPLPSRIGSVSMRSKQQARLI